jgi:hypothetical protein
MARRGRDWAMLSLSQFEHRAGQEALQRARAAGKARKLQKDLRLLAKFVQVFCKHKHAERAKAPFALKTHDVDSLCRPGPLLCAPCARLLGHAFIKRTRCPYDPKPMCKKCPTHCYAQHCRDEMREVMKYSGRRLVLTGRLDYLLHLFF